MTNTPYSKINETPYQDPQGFSQAPASPYNTQDPYKNIQGFSSAPGSSGSGSSKKKRKSKSIYAEPQTPYQDPQGSSSAPPAPPIPENTAPVNPKLPPTQDDNSKVLREAYLRSQANNQRARAPEETQARNVPVNQTAIKVGIDTSTYKSYTGEYLTGQDARTRKLNEARQEFRSKFVDPAKNPRGSSYAPSGLSGLNQGVKLGGTILAVGTVSAGAGLYSGVKGAIKDVSTGEIITKTGESLTELVVNPKGVYQELKAQALKNPFYFAGEQISYTYTLNKIPGVVKNVYKGSVSYLRRYDVAGSKYDPLTDPYNDFIDPDATFNQDIVVNYQTTLNGMPVNPETLFKRSPLKLEETSLYYGKDARALEAGAVVKGNNFRVDDYFLSSAEYVQSTEGILNIKYGDIKIKAPVRSERVFGETYVGERTKTDFFPDINPVDNFKIEVRSKPAPESLGEPVLRVEIKTPPKEIQKKLNFGKRNLDGTDKYLGANIGLFTETQKLGTSIYNEFKPNFKDLNPASEIEGASRSPVLRSVPPVPFIKLNPYQDIKNNTSILIEPVQVQTPKEITEGKINYKIDEKILPGEKYYAGGSYDYNKKNKIFPVYDLKINQITESVQDQSHISEPITIPIITPVIKQSYYNPPRETEKSRTIIPFIKTKNESPVKKITGFDVLVRKKGKFIRVNTGALSKIEAINLGAVKVGTSASATFKIKNSNLTSSQSFKGRGNLQDFYNKDNLFIEKRSRRIKSLGELQEITYKGLQAQKFKKIF
jgi:hypothetical protein